MSGQDYINDAVAAGIPLAAIQNFLAGNPGDYSRIMSALGPDYRQGSGGSVQPYAPAQPYAAPSQPYAAPTLGSSLTSASPSDGNATGVLQNTALPALRPAVVPASGGSNVTVLPASGGFPPWAVFAVLAVLAYLLTRK